MAANSDHYPATLATMNAIIPPDQRRRPRMRVHWPLRFYRSSGPATVETMTQDLSSDGFYCLARGQFVAGEALACVLGVPTYHPNTGHMVWVECRARIVRVAPAAEEGCCGIGCRIEEYRFSAAHQ